jgi:hypothetical protein
MYDRQGDTIFLTPLGIVGSDGICPEHAEDIFWAIDSVDIEPLGKGVYTILFKGKNAAIIDTLHIPVAAIDSIFEFDISVVNNQSDVPVTDYPLSVEIWAPLDTSYVDTTDSEGHAEIQFSSSIVEQIRYRVEPIGYDPRIRFVSTIIYKGRPEVIKLRFVE